MVHDVENFHGVYLLYNENPNAKVKGRIYIGYTVNPNRRITQHNRGRHAGGAAKTSGKGPWAMVLIVHGFPNEISGLRFEWAWQHPEKSRRLRHLKTKASKEKVYEYRFRVFSEMLRTSPWNRFALTIRWLRQEYKLDFAPHLAPPVHMAIAFGPVRTVKVGGGTQRGKGQTQSSQSVEVHIQRVVGDGDDDEGTRANDDGLPETLAFRVRCAVCYKSTQTDVTSSIMKCYHPGCHMQAHVLCLARSYLRNDPDHVIPISGSCPKCKHDVLWGDLVRHQSGCYQQIADSDSEDNDEHDSHWAMQLQSQAS